MNRPPQFGLFPPVRPTATPAFYVRHCYDVLLRFLLFRPSLSGVSSLGRTKEEGGGRGQTGRGSPFSFDSTLPSWSSQRGYRKVTGRESGDVAFLARHPKDTAKVYRAKTLEGRVTRHLDLYTVCRKFRVRRREVGVIRTPQLIN